MIYCQRCTPIARICPEKPAACIAGATGPNKLSERDSVGEAGFSKRSLLMLAHKRDTLR